MIRYGWDMKNGSNSYKMSCFSLVLSELGVYEPLFWENVGRKSEKVICDILKAKTEKRLFNIALQYV